MASVAWKCPRTGVWRFSVRDSALVALAVLHAAVLAVWPVAPLIAVGVWWNSNTIAHNFIHRPFFRAAWANRMFSAALSVLLGIPQALWRERHLAHHAGVEWRLRVSPRLVIETALVIGFWVGLASLRPQLFLAVYMPGYLAGLLLCAMQGRWEHDGAGRPVSHYGRIYNLLCFNDGYHAEHHAAPAMHWAALPQLKSGDGRNGLETLERIVLRSPLLQRFVLRTHRRAFQTLLPRLGEIRSVTIVGGGLFPRTALILSELLPAARLTIVDSDARNLRAARELLGDNAEFRHERFLPGESLACDLAVIPLCLRGDRAEVYRHPASPAVLVHDWIWRRRGTGTVVSVTLLKRLNLVRR